MAFLPSRLTCSSLWSWWLIRVTLLNHLKTTSPCAVSGIPQMLAELEQQRMRLSLPLRWLLAEFPGW